jgi:hypothetical protein
VRRAKQPPYVEIVLRVGVGVGVGVGATSKLTAHLESKAKRGKGATPKTRSR